MSRKFENLFSFSKRQKLICLILMIIVLSINSFAGIIYAEESSTDSKDSSQPKSNSNNTNDTEASETQEQSSETDTNSTFASTQSNEDNTFDEEEQTLQNSTASEPESQEGNSTSSVSDSQGTNQTSASTSAIFNQTSDSTSNSTGTVEESTSDGYQNINSTSATTSNSTTSYPDQQQNNNSTVGLDNNSANSNNGSGIIPPANNSTNYNNSTQTVNNTATENNSNENATATTIDANNNSTTSQALNQNATTSAASPLAPDFTISVNPLTLSINAGSSASYSVIVTSENGFNSNVSLTITSSAIPGITASLGSNITKPPINASIITLLTIQSDAMTHGGKYKLKVTGFAANVTGTRAASVTLEVIGQNITATSTNDTLGLDAVALTPILIKDIGKDDIFNYYGSIPAEKMVFISTTVVNNYNETQPFILVMEIRDKSHQTLSIQLLRGVLNSDGQLQFDISWMPVKTGTYEIRSFVIDRLQDPSPLTAVIGRTWTIT